jgi:hypothetical protein
MTKRVIDADAILKRARPLTQQHAHEFQPYGHFVRSRGRRKAAKKSPSRSRGCCMRTRSCWKRRARWPGVRPRSVTMAPTI